MNLADDILAHINIVDYISKYVPLRRAGSNRTGNCPFHKEKTPSFMVSETKQIFKCFGCGKGGNVITFAMEYERLDFVDTLKVLAETAHLDLNNYNKFHSDPAVKESKEHTKSINQLAAQHFSNNLQANPTALEYLHQRNLDDQIIQTFGLGYAPDGYYDLINYLKKMGCSTEQILESGLCKTGPSGDIYDFFRKRIIFPIRDVVNNIVAFAGRVTDSQDSPKYLNLSDTPLYDKSKTLYGIHLAKQHIAEHKCIIVVEGYMDVIGLYRIGLPVGLATCGTALTEEHLKQIKRYSDTVILLFDNDDAGRAATIRALKMAYAYDLYPSVLSLPDGMKDIDDFANAGKTKEDLLATKQDGMLFVLETMKKRHDLNNPVEKKKIINECFDLIRSIADLGITQHYIGAIAHHFDLSDQIVLSQYKMWYKQNRSYQSRIEPEIKSNKRDTKQLLDAIIYNDNRKQYTQNEIIVSHIQYYKTLQQHTSSTESTGKADNGELLRRDHETHDLDDNKVTQLIGSMLKKETDILLRQLIKTSILSAEEKGKLLEERKKLG
ncbi:MAG: DNA primase [Candidatus Absconditabacterales bacterium]